MSISPRKDAVHYGSGHQPKCRPNRPFVYHAWATWDKAKVTCKRCLASIARTA